MSFSRNILVCFIWEMSQLLGTVFNVPQHLETESYPLLGKQTLTEWKTGNL